jgi:hypothetical protein
MVSEYPRGPLLQALDRAQHYGLFELSRVERMVLAAIASDFFRLRGGDEEDDS